MIHSGKITKLTTDVENAFGLIAEHRPSILRKIYNRYVAVGELPPIETL